MAHELLKGSENPKIQNSGKAVFSKNHYCLWSTTDGSISTCTVQNPGTANTLTVVISGAPATMMTTDGELFNGQHRIPPNNPTHNITAVGDFTGVVVTLFNMSSLDTDCGVNVVIA